jgi:hypothetical protein
MSDYAEFVAGTDPTNPKSLFHFVNTTKPQGGQFQITWTVVTNRLYQVFASTNLANWQPITSQLQASNNPTMSCTATNTGKAAYYRVEVRP